MECIPSGLCVDLDHLFESVFPVDACRPMNAYPKKAVITAAGVSHRHLPVQTLTGRDGYAVSTLYLQIQDLVDAGIERIGMVVAPGAEALYREAAGGFAERLVFIEQRERMGYGHAVAQSRSFVGDDPFILMVADHIFVSEPGQKNCVAQVIEPFLSENCPVSAVQSTHESQIRFFGTVGGEYFDANRALFKIHRVLEKPTPTQAEQDLWVPGMRSGYYLCFFGIHVLTPVIFDYLHPLKDGGFMAFSDALQKLAVEGQYLALGMKGRRYDLENRHGLLFAQLALALDSKHRDEVLSGLVQLLAGERNAIL